MAAMGAQAQPQAAQGGFWANYRSHTGPDAQPKAAEDDRLWAGQCGHSRGKGWAISCTSPLQDQRSQAPMQPRTARRSASADAVRVRNRRMPPGASGQSPPERACAMPCYRICGSEREPGKGRAGRCVDSHPALRPPGAPSVGKAAVRQAGDLLHFMPSRGGGTSSEQWGGGPLPSCRIRQPEPAAARRSHSERNSGAHHPQTVRIRSDSMSGSWRAKRSGASHHLL